MSVIKTNIFVYAHWQGLADPKLIGVLTVQEAKGKRSFGFSYQPSWLETEGSLLLDPDIEAFTGIQYPRSKEMFGLFADSMPDTWGRTLMRRRAVQKAKEKTIAPKGLTEVDFLLGVNDATRMGGLRFKLDPEGPFLDDDTTMPTPPWASVRELQHSVELLESDKDNREVRKWLAMLIVPGSSLGGARPKANIQDAEGQLWIAKFPSKNDTIDKAAWEYLVYLLAINAKILMSDCRIEKVSGKYHTFFTKRFDRQYNERIHFASAMTMTGSNEEALRDQMPSYLEIAEFIQYSGSHNTIDLHQLWRRIVFNCLISNTDDHMRNHGFILSSDGWRLSPAYDINPSVDKNGLALNIDMNDNSLDLELVKSVGKYFQLKPKEMDSIIDEVKHAVMPWEQLAKEIGISRNERELMRPAFRI
jgi:serine/threonine-protein kinase HipA